MIDMTTLIDTHMTMEIARQRRSTLETVARRGRRPSVARRWWRPDRRRRGDTGPPGTVVIFPVATLSPVSTAAPAAVPGRSDEATTRVA